MRKRDLAEAGYGPNNPLRFTLIAVATGDDSGRVEVAQQQLKRIGVEAQIEILPQNSTNYLGNLDLVQGKYDSIWGVRSPCTPDSTRWMGTLYLTCSSRNVLGISDPKLDVLAAAQMREMDPVKRKHILDEMQDYLFELRPYFVTDSRRYFRFDHCRIKNLRGIDQQQSHRGLEKAWIDSSGC